MELSVNAICALNLAYFRKAAGLTQEELGEMIGWGKSMVSTAERSANESGRVRQFSANDLVSIARALKIPLAALFLPPEDHGTAVRYIVTDAPYDEESEADTLLPTLFPTYKAVAGSPAMDAYRKRALAAGTTSWSDFAVRVQEVADAAAEILARNRGRHEDEDERYRQALDERLRALGELLAQREALNQQVTELRLFEREYRRRLQEFVEGQLRAIYAGHGPIDPDAVIDAARLTSSGPDAGTVTALLLSDDGTYQTRRYRSNRAASTEETAEGLRTDAAGSGTAWGNLSAKDTATARTAMRDLQDRGIPGPYVVVKEGAMLTVMSATGAGVQARGDADERQRLPAVLLP